AAESDNSVYIRVTLGGTGRNGGAGASPSGQTPLKGGGILVTVDPSHSSVAGSDPSYTTSGLMAHEVTESYLRITAGPGQFGPSYPSAHRAAVPFEDSALLGAGYISRTARSIYGIKCQPASFAGTAPFGGNPPADCFTP